MCFTVTQTSEGRKDAKTAGYWHVRVPHALPINFSRILIDLRGPSKALASDK
jgi:hypothetical protein